jgi:aerobic carbon-monoxide dehydrogenase medium subunit
MKLPAFDYKCPATLAEAIDILASHAGAARPLAGGQTLLPVLAFRLADPAVLVDLRRLPGLDRIAIADDGIRIGAMVRWRDIEEHAGLRTACPILPDAIAHVAHYQIRNRGTVGGSLAHGDPAAEMPGLAVVLDAEIEIAGSAGDRTLPAAAFFLGPLTTALRPDELITGVRIPRWPAARRWAFEEFAMRRGDYAMAAIALFYDEDAGRVRDPHVGVIAATDVPRRLAAAEAALEGRALDEHTIMAAAKAAAAAVRPPADIHAGAAYRRALVETLTERALRRAAARQDLS